MHGRLEVNTYTLRRDIKRIYHGDRYIFREGGRYRWLQRIALKILDRLGCREKVETKEELVRRDVLDLDRLRDQVAQSLEEARQCRYSGPLAIYMGPEEFDDLRNEISESRYFMDMLYLNPYGHPGDINYLGMPLFVVPYMDGCIVLPQRPGRRP